MNAYWGLFLLFSVVFLMVAFALLRLSAVHRHHAKQLGEFRSEGANSKEE